MSHKNESCRRSIIDASNHNHWSRCPWIAVEGEHTALIQIITDQDLFLFGIVRQGGITGDDRQLANHLIELHNKTLTREVKHAEDSSRKSGA